MANGAQYLAGGGEGQVPQWWGVYFGYIAVNADPLAQGRVRLRVPQVFGGTTSGWASPMVPLTYIPRVGTPVTVMFVGGDPGSPVWFGNFALPDAASGIVFSATAPSDPTIGEVWVNTTDGLMSEWNGAGWVAYQIGGSAIATGVGLTEPNITGGTITGAEFVGTNWIENSAGSFFYSGTPALGNLAASTASTAGTDGFGNAYLAGSVLYGPGNSTINMSWTTTTKMSQPVLVLFPDSSWAYTGNAPFVTALNNNKGLATEFNAIAIGSGNPPSTSAKSQVQLFSGSPDGTTSVPHVSFYGGNSAALMADIAPTGINITRGSGMSGAVPIVTTDTTDDTNANNATQPCTMQWNIPAGDARVGTVYEVDTTFNGTTGTTTTAALAFRPRLNGVSVTTSAGDTIAAGFFPAATGFAGAIKLKMVVLTTGASGTVSFFLDGGIGANAAKTSATVNGTYLSSQATVQAFDTTVPNTLGINTVWGSSQAGQTVTAHGSTFTRKGP